MSRKQRNAQRQVANLLRGRNDPHGGSLTDEAVMRGIEITEAGDVRIWIRPPRPHCPCCLFDLEKLRDSLASQKAVASITIEAVEIPDADRWTSALAAD